MSTSELEARLVRIGVVAEQIGISERTLRYYEECGLVTPAAYSRGGARLYDDKAIGRVSRIRALQSLMGFNLEEIKDILKAEDQLDNIRTAYRKSSKPKRELLEAAGSLLVDLLARAMEKQNRLREFHDDLQLKLDKINVLLSEDTKG